MDRNMLLGILGITLFALAAAILLPGGRTVDNEPKLPWIIDVESPEKLSVMGITLGQSTLGEAENIFKAGAKVTLFRSADGKYAIEAYFQRIYLSSIRADLVVTLDVDKATTDGMFNRGVRISNISNGAKKVDLSSDDLESIKQAKISHITYIPASDLDEDLLLSRFGEPAERLKELDSKTTHWLYPSKGLDIAVNPDGKEVFQYILPAHFDLVTEPLRSN
ncbi:MAG: hypothetical protein RPU73_03645 [Candidatus Sedimenticola sp. (ex Thyasira tokunagai)]